MTDSTTGTARSRFDTGRKGARKATKARLALSGPSGAGKTWTALSTAEVLAPDGPTVVIDTEPGDGSQGASELYGDRFRFDVIQWDPPYDPRDLAITMGDLGRSTLPDGWWPDHDGGYGVLIVDSGSHFWRGEGGTLDIADGRFGGWKTATPVQDHLVQAILRWPGHVIFCTRAKQAYLVNETAGKDGGTKQKVTKLGLAPIQRDDLEYEFQVVAMIDAEHRIDIGKTRAAVLAGKSYPANQQGRFAGDYRGWLDEGLQVISQAQADHLVSVLNGIEPDEARKAAKRDFVATFGRPEHIDAEHHAMAAEWVAERVSASPDEAPFSEDEAIEAEVVE